MYVYDNSGSGVSTTPWFTYESNQNSADFGHSVAFGDLDGDGNADVFVGSPIWDEAGVSNAGKAFFFKSSGTTLTEDSSHVGLSANKRVGVSVAFGMVESNLPGFIVGVPDDGGGVVAVWKYSP